MIGLPLLLLVLGQAGGNQAAVSGRNLKPPPFIAAPAAVSASAPVQPSGSSDSGTITEQRQARLKGMIEKRKARRSKGSASRTQVLEGIRHNQQMAAAAAAQNAAQTQQAYSNLQQSSAMAGISAAMQRQADIDRSRYVLDSQRAGVPQVFVPGQGMMPYQYGIATPAPSYLLAPPAQAPLAPLATPP